MVESEDPVRKLLAKAFFNSITIEVVKKLADQAGFQVLSRRWVVERFFAWINRNRELAKDFEGIVALVEAFPYAASVMLRTRRLALSASALSRTLGPCPRRHHYRMDLDPSPSQREKWHHLYT